MLPPHAHSVGYRQADRVRLLGDQPRNPPKRATAADAPRTLTNPAAHGAWKPAAEHYEEDARATAQFHDAGLRRAVRGPGPPEHRRRQGLPARPRAVDARARRARGRGPRGGRRARPGAAPPRPPPPPPPAAAGQDGAGRRRRARFRGGAAGTRCGASRRQVGRRFCVR